MNATIREANGYTKTFLNVHLYTGVKDAKGVDIYEGDRVNAYVPMLDKYVSGTVEYNVEDGNPCWIVRFDKSYKYERLITELLPSLPYEDYARYLHGYEVIVMQESKS